MSKSETPVDEVAGDVGPSLKGQEWNGIGGGGPNEDAPGRGGSEGGAVCNGGT